MSIDGDDYAARIELLTRDTAHLAPSLLRKACDLAAQTARGLPYASEILSAAALIVEQRQSAQSCDPAYTGPKAGDKAAAYFAGNVRALQQGLRLMMTGGGDMFKLGDTGERRGVRSDGSVIEPWFHRSKGDGDTITPGWYCRDEDRGELARCYREHGSDLRLIGCRIVGSEA